MNTNKPLILVTNDDSINAKGIKVLIDQARKLGDVLVVAPQYVQSGKSSAITTAEPLYLKKRHQEEGLEIFICSGTPVDCVKMAFNTLVKDRRKPDVLLSGINHGTNSSVCVLYSGTMGAALEGALHDTPSIGFSLDSFDSDADFSMAEQYVYNITKDVLENGLPSDTCLNVNFPKPEKDYEGMIVCRQTRGKWIEDLEKKTNPYNKEYYWLTGKYSNKEPQSTDTDEWALAHNYVSIVPTTVDMTAHKTLNSLATRLTTKTSLKQ